MKTIVSTNRERVERAAALIAGLLREKPDAVIALSASDDCLPVYRRLAEEKEIDLSAARFFAATEFEGLSADDEKSCRMRLSAALARTGAEITFLSSNNLEQYETLIAAAGGLDLAVLGLGINARIGFNEIATPFDSRTHRQKLAPASRRELAALFGSAEQVPVYGLTMGIKTLTQARRILVTASGEERAKAVFDMLYGRDDSVVPAAFLQIPPDVTVLVDEAAASML
ncbi:MAG: 6-phosphogluconolactonase [Oscillospiraceae bacterium]|nr:6-phosphogluconolactonase [Oscillospiraceae bacterium]